MKVALQPVGSGKESKQHYADTIETPVVLADHADLLHSEDLAAFKNLYPSGHAQLWGVTPAADRKNITQYDKLSPGDLACLFMDSRLAFVGRVTHLFHNEELAERLWGRKDDGQTWEYMYALEEISRPNIPNEEFKPGLKKGPQRIAVVDDTDVKADAVLSRIGLRELGDNGAEEVAVPQFVVGETYNRKRDIHDKYEGQEQSGIITPQAVPAIFAIATSASAENYGYEDEWLEDGTLLYFGEGQEGDMEFVRGNKAIRDHQQNGEDLHVFVNRGGGELEYRGRFVYLDHELTRGPDANGDEREVIIFELAPEAIAKNDLAKAEAELSGTDLATLREIASSGRKKKRTKGSSNRKTNTVKATPAERSVAVKDYVLARADGVCEGCGEDAPFMKKVDGRPYLEPHHATRLADEGPDHPENVIALCPNCHRRVHSGADGARYNETLKRTIREKETG